jgi:ABC-type lipoprotein export system ATPase subunit
MDTKSEIEFLKEKIQTEKSKQEQINQAKERLIQIEKTEQILNIQNQIVPLEEHLDDIEIEIQNTEQAIQSSRNRIDICEEASVLASEKVRLKSEREQIILLNNKLVHLNKMKMIANELEHKRMITVLQTISDFSNEMLTMLFDEPMKIEFQVFKMNKTQKTVKPSIVYKLLYKGNEIDHLDQLSGGEADRVSLAVSCALFQMSSFPFLLLDEFAASLDLNNKESAIQMIKGCVLQDRQKSVLCISHDTVEGIYDYHVKL